jgi:hypothetical protein
MGPPARERAHQARLPDPASSIPLATGLSSAALVCVTERHTTAGGAHWYARRIHKTVSARAGWLGALSGDSMVREVGLWTSGMLSRLPAAIATGVLEASREIRPDGTFAGSLTMKDLAGYRLRDRRGQPLRSPPLTPPGGGGLPPVVLTILSHLARFHATFWEDPILDDQSAGLMGAREALLLLSPDWLSSRIAEGDEASYPHTALLGWDAFFQLAGADDTTVLARVARRPERVLATLAGLPRTLVHGDVWGPNLGLLPATSRAPRQGRRLLLLDFALATAGPPTYDVLWLPGTWHALDPVRVLAAYRFQLQRALRARGRPMPAATWRSLADAGYLRTALTCGEALARTAREAPAGAGRRRLEARVRWWAARAAAAALRLESGASHGAGEASSLADP